MPWVVSPAICECFGEQVAATNATLIASAPELAEATANLLGLFDNAVYRRRLAGDALYAEAIEQARAALAKAKGQYP
jgi:hypothetical protein